MHDNTLVIGLSAALLLAVGWVLFFVGRVVISIIRDARVARRARPTLEHPEFGTLTCDSGLWSGKLKRGGRDVRFTVAGAGTKPNFALLESLRDSFTRLPELERTALEFLRAENPEVRQGDFTFESLDLLWEQNPDAFAMEFALTGDDDGVWRVEFEAGRPKFVGRDD